MQLMSTGSKSLPSVYQLPIIVVVMKTGFSVSLDRRGEKGNEHGGEQLRRHPRSVYPTPPQSLRSPVSSGSPLTKNPANRSFRSLCRSAGACPHFASRMTSRGCARFSVAKNPPTTKNTREITQYSGISNRSWPKNRSYRKQKTKPLPTGARTAFSDSGYLRGVRVRGGGRRGWFSRIAA
jgi:hypothetical protein